MKTMLVRSAILLPILALAFAVVASGSHASSSSSAVRLPSGESPDDALDIACSWESLLPTSNVWYKLQGRDNKPLLIRLISYPGDLDGLEFQVYVAKLDGGQGEPIVTGPIGHGQITPSRIVQEWTGAPIDRATYYVNVINDNAFQVDYGLCDPYRRLSPWQEWQ